MTTNTNGDNAIPPKLSFKPGEGSSPDAGAGKKRTARVDLPKAAPDPATGLKKKTSRIPLDQVSAEPGAPTGAPVPGMGASKTIRLAPAPSSVPTITIAPSSKSTSAALLPDDVKRQTSRIPLDAATTERQEPAAGVPKTIRIKRPAGLQSVPIVSPAAQEEQMAAEMTGKTVTSRIDLPEQEISEEGQATQRKTIKIRRAEGGAVKPAPRSMAVARVEAQAAARAEADVAAPHAVFPLLAAAAVVLLCVMVYVLLLQAYPNLGWNFPGKVTL